MPEQSPDAARSELENLLGSEEPAAVLDAILGNTPSFVVIAPDGKVLRFSDYSTRILGRTRSEVEGRTVAELIELLPAYDMSGRPLPVSERPTNRALLGEVVTGFEFLAEAADGERIPVVVNSAPIHNARGKLIGAISSATDLRPYRALEQSLREAVTQREGLYTELTHRVKNHLQILSGLVSLQAHEPGLTAADLAEVVTGRLNALSAVYDSMTLAGAGARVAALAFLEEVCRPYLSDAVAVEASAQPPDLTLTSEQASSVGMLANEAVCNSWKHAFPDGRGRVWVSLQRVKPGRLRLDIADDGAGWAPPEEDRKSHGLEVMRLSARGLAGELKFGRRPGGGTLVTTELPEADA